ncbi:MAG: orotidine-5'-phosphate decarboxylase [Pseudomonadota bacterium]
MIGSERVIVALDLPDRSACDEITRRIGPDLRYVKIGSRLFTSEGPSILAWARERGFRVFLDLKFHDIPNTVEEAVAAVASLEAVSLLTVHASGGREMIRAARKGSERAGANRPRILAVTALTSLTEGSLQEIGFSPADPASVAGRLGRLAMDSGADGLICSAMEVAHLRETLPKNILLVVPGIRSVAGDDDQKRTASAGEAIHLGADYLVVGRPILGSTDPRKAFLDLVRETESR